MNVRELEDLAKELKCLEAALMRKGIRLNKLAEEGEYLLPGSLTAIAAGLPVFDCGALKRERGQIFHAGCFVKVLKKASVKSKGPLPQTRVIDRSTKNYVALYHALLIVEYQTKQLPIILAEQKLLSSQIDKNNKELAELNAQNEKISQQEKNLSESLFGGVGSSLDTEALWNLASQKNGLLTKIRMANHELEELVKRQSELEARSLACEHDIRFLKAAKLPKLRAKIPELNEGFLRPEDRAPLVLTEGLGVKPAQSPLPRASYDQQRQRLEIVEAKLALEAESLQAIGELMAPRSAELSRLTEQKKDIELRLRLEIDPHAQSVLDAEKYKIEAAVKDCESQEFQVKNAYNVVKTRISELEIERDHLTAKLKLLSAESEGWHLHSFPTENKEGEPILSSSSSSSSASALSEESALYLSSAESGVSTTQSGRSSSSSSRVLSDQSGLGAAPSLPPLPGSLSMMLFGQSSSEQASSLSPANGSVSEVGEVAATAGQGRRAKRPRGGDDFLL